MTDSDQLLKCGTDTCPIVLTPNLDRGAPASAFTLAGDQSSSWLKKGEAVTPPTLRHHIEPWLTALCQSEHVSLLIGSGLTHALHWMAADKGLAGMAPAHFNHYGAAISRHAKALADAAGRTPGNFEDQIRAANQLLHGLAILCLDEPTLSAKAEALREDLIKQMNDFAQSILIGEKGLATAPAEKLENAMNYLVSFLMSFASRTGTRDRLHIFTTNYDRCIEFGAEIAGLHLLDRFVGGLAPIFRSSRLDIDLHYNPPGIRGEPRYVEGVARFTKLHGSLDWIDTAGAIRRTAIPFGADGIEPYLRAPGLNGADALQLMIYPNAAKDRETAAYPFIELFRDFAAAICRPNSTLFTFGYSFGDEHINRVIEDMLTIPSTHLVIMSHGDPLNRISQTYDRLGRHSQITLLIGNHLGDFRTLIDNYLPKPAIDRTTFRMADLLRSRLGTRTEHSISSRPASMDGDPAA